ncbi:hypothetical protein U7537_04510 [Lacticaseibacillus rhamnosus]
MEEIIKQVAPILNILSPIILGVLAYWEFNKKNKREQHNDDIESRDKLIESLRQQNEDLYKKRVSAEKLIDELRKELNDRKKDES